MRTMLLMVTLGIGAVFVLGGCTDEVYIVRPDNTPPSVPKGIYSITGDEAVYLFWEANDERDFKEYRIYRSDDGGDYFRRIATTRTNEYVDQPLKNGFTYFYVVTARDKYGNESDFSKIAFDTPRPEGWGKIIQDYHRFPGTAGYDFSEYDVTHWQNPHADVYLDYDDYYGVFFLCVTDDATDIQDFGYTDDLDDVTWSPEDGWSDVGWVEVIFGHSYIIWTRDDHYAKLRVAGFTFSYGIVFDWAYQVDEGNQELVPRPKHAENYLRKEAMQGDNAEK